MYLARVFSHGCVFIRWALNIGPQVEHSRHFQPGQPLENSSSLPAQPQCPQAAPMLRTRGRVYTFPALPGGGFAENHWTPNRFWRDLLLLSLTLSNLSFLGFFVRKHYVLIMDPSCSKSSAARFSWVLTVSQRGGRSRHPCLTDGACSTEVPSNLSWWPVAGEWGSNRTVRRGLGFQPHSLTALLYGTAFLFSAWRKLRALMNWDSFPHNSISTIQLRSNYTWNL